MTTDADLLLEELKSNGVQYYVTVPDSVARPLWQRVARDPGIRMIKVCHEADAVAVAAGLHIAGARCVVAMENSGFFNAIDAIRALPIDMQIPMVLLVSWVGRVRPNQSTDEALAESMARRGPAGTHVTWQGAMTEPLLRTIGVAHATMEGAAGARLVSWAFRSAEATRQPAAVLFDRLEGH